MDNSLYVARVTYGMPRWRTFLQTQRLMLTADTPTAAIKQARAAVDAWILSGQISMANKNAKARNVDLQLICKTSDTVPPTVM